MMEILQENLCWTQLQQDDDLKLWVAQEHEGECPTLAQISTHIQMR